MAKSKVLEVSLINSVPNFSGEKHENVNFFIDQIESVAKLENWSDSKKLLVLKLNCKGKALQFISNNTEVTKCNLSEQFKKILVSKFTNQLSFTEKQQNFSSISQQPNQSVKDLAEKITSATNEFLDIEETNTQFNEFAQKMKLNKLYEALRADLRVELKKVNPTSFDEAVKTAINIENALNDPAASSNNILISEIAALMQHQSETNKKIDDLSRNIGTISSVNAISQHNMSQHYPNTSDRPSVSKNYGSHVQDHAFNKPTCLVCGKNHLTISCWYLPKPNRGYQNRGFRARNNNSRYFNRGSRSQQGNNRRFNNRSHPYQKNNRNDNLN